MDVTALRLDSDDNVVCLLRAHEGGERAVLEDGSAIALIGPAPLGHKVAAMPIAEGAPVIKYGAPIGHATRPIAAGEHVHLHNLAGDGP